MNDPAQMNSRALNSACVTMWKKARFGMCIPILIIIRPNCLSVDKAIIFFMSHSVIALSPAMNIVVVPIVRIIILKSVEVDRNW
jgi:hypothetical protein